LWTCKSSQASPGDRRVRWQCWRNIPCPALLQWQGRLQLGRALCTMVQRCLTGSRSQTRSVTKSDTRSRARGRSCQVWLRSNHPVKSWQGRAQCLRSGGVERISAKFGEVRFKTPAREERVSETRPSFIRSRAKHHPLLLQLHMFVHYIETLNGALNANSSLKEERSPG
jgi:hypothetical protein